MAGSGPFGLLTSAFGQRDVRDDIADYQAQQLTRNRAAAGLDPDGNPLPPQAAPAAPPQAGAAPVPIQMQDPSQTPNAHKTPADLGTLLMRLGQQEESNQGFNQALGMGFAAFAQPRDREMVSKMFNTNLQDPNALGKTLFEANNQQAGQDQTNAIRFAINDPRQGRAIADKLHVSWEALKAMAAADPGAPGKIATALGMPTDALKNITQLGEMGGGGPGGKPATDAQGNPITDVTKGIVAGVAGSEFVPINTAQENWRNDPKNQGKPDSAMPWKRGDIASYNQYVANQKELNDSVAVGQASVQTQLPTLINMQRKIQDIRSDPNLDTLLANPAKRAMAQKLLDHDRNDPWNVALRTVFPNGKYGLSTEELRLVSNIRQLNGQEYAQALDSLHQSRPAASEIAAMKTGIGQTQSLSDLTPKSFREQGLDELDDSLRTTIGNTYGQSQMFKDMPDEYRSYVGSQFTKGGARNIEGSGSEDWADAVKPDAKEIKDAQDAIDSGKSRAYVERQMRRHGMIPMGLHDKARD